ncbi:MAG: adenylyltransferase/cytidyltransferase family protein [Chloroflexi bacterium]|nr:adenylyltransferase/cytidyltransferase family protein [Chloroflexota bacterium]
MPKKVFVSGCFDLLHSGHVEFFQSAAAYGDELYVALGSDKTVYDLKGRPPINTEEERRFMVQNVACVHKAFVSQGSGYLDFEPELRAIHPDVFVVNEDGNTPDKRKLVESLGIEYVVLKRTPHSGLKPRSTTELRSIDCLPYRIDLAGGWLDQPFVSKHHPGSVITLSIEPTIEFNERSGMATSTRRTAMKLWGNRLPIDDPHKLAYILFCCDNPPGTTEISGAQDTIGLIFSGLARSDYDGQYWPHHIEHLPDEDALRFVENLIVLIPLGPREDGYNVLSKTYITSQRAQALAEATDDCWQAILERDAVRFGAAVRRSFEAQVAMFPHMVSATIMELIEQYRDLALGYKISGAGGGGYLILVADREIENGIHIVARRTL